MTLLSNMASLLNGMVVTYANTVIALWPSCDSWLSKQLQIGQVTHPIHPSPIQCINTPQAKADGTGHAQLYDCMVSESIAPPGHST